MSNEFLCDSNMNINIEQQNIHENTPILSDGFRHLSPLTVKVPNNTPTPSSFTPNDSLNRKCQLLDDKQKQKNEFLLPSLYDVSDLNIVKNENKKDNLLLLLLPSSSSSSSTSPSSTLPASILQSSSFKKINFQKYDNSGKIQNYNINNNNVINSYSGSDIQTYSSSSSVSSLSSNNSLYSLYIENINNNSINNNCSSSSSRSNSSSNNSSSCTNSENHIRTVLLEPRQLHLIKNQDSMTESNLFHIKQSAKNFEYVTKIYTNNNNMRRDTLTTLSTVATNINNSTNNTIQIDYKSFANNISVKSEEYGLNIISTASLATSPIPMPTPFLQFSTGSRNVNSSNENEKNHNLLHSITTKNGNSNFIETEKQLLTNSQKSLPLNIGSSKRNFENNILLDTAAVVLSTLRSSPFKFHDRGSSSYATPFRYTLNPVQISSPNSPSSNNDIHLNGNSLNSTIFPNNNLLMENTITRPHSSSFSSFPLKNYRPILRIHHHKEEDSSTTKINDYSHTNTDQDKSKILKTFEEKKIDQINTQDDSKSIKSQNKSFATIPQGERNVTWNKNGKRIKNENNNITKTKENITSQILKRQTVTKKGKKRLKELRYKNKTLNNSIRTNEKVKSFNLINQKDKNQNNKGNTAVDKTKLIETKNISSTSPSTSISTTGTRSRTGCWICRLRKKKCSEEKPKCFNCERLSLDCVYSLVKPDFVTNENLRKTKLQEIKICTREAKRKSMKKRSGSSGSSNCSDNNCSHTNTAGKIQKIRKLTNDKQSINKKENALSNDTNSNNESKEKGVSVESFYH